MKQTGTAHALGLIRIDNELVVGGPYAIEPSAIGSIIGALALEDGAVTDVGPDASARHLRIFTESNVWYAQDLGSANGTYLVEASNGKKLDISSGAPVQLHPGDILATIILLSGNTLQRISIQARSSSSTKPKKQFSSLMDRPWIPLDRAGMNLRLKICRY